METRRFIDKQENIILIGTPGAGRTHKEFCVVRSIFAWTNFALPRFWTQRPV
ncbi:MAG: ATP-binding protein [Clostridiales bacterium]|nr:ATP-binding protein [Clostridiales bacterium]